ncbi:hypothetical protein [Thalassotalea montiporae]
MQYTYFRLLAIASAALTAWITSIADSNYRSWSYQHDINDFGFANYSPSIFGTITTILLLIGIFYKSPKDLGTNAGYITLGCMAYELLQPTLGTGVFDWQDIAAVAITGGLLSYGLKRLQPKLYLNAAN